MKELKDSVINSLDGTDKKILPFIPFLLQDLWEIGSSPQIIIQLLKKHSCLNVQSKVLDLGCGKGAISVNIAEEVECQAHGIDAMPEFIKEANYWADKYHQNHLCSFEVADIRERIKELKGFDLIVLGSIGSVFGDIETTLKCISPSLVNNGYVILDDGYIPEDSDFENENYLKKSEAEKQIHSAGYKIIEAFKMEDSFIEESDLDIYEKIEYRAQELIQKHPNKKYMFEEYLRNQRIENDILENKIECVTWLLKK